MKEEMKYRPIQDFVNHRKQPEQQEGRGVILWAFYAAAAWIIAFVLVVEVLQ